MQLTPIKKALISFILSLMIFTSHLECTSQSNAKQAGSLSENTFAKGQMGKLYQMVANAFKEQSGEEFEPESGKH